MKLPKIKYTDRKFLHNLYLMLGFAVFVFVPDLIIKLCCHLPIQIEFLFFWGVLLFGFLLSLTNKIIFLLITILVLIMQLIQLNFMAYFGNPIEPANIMNIFRESKDIFDPAYLKHTWFVTPTLLILYTALVYAFGHLKPIKVPFIWLIILYMAAHKPYRAYTQTKGIWYFQPAIVRPSLKNSISTFSYFVFQYWPQGYQNMEVEYLPYQVKKIDSKVQNILLIWGESLYAEHLPMFGYERNTFPKMSALINTDRWQTSLGLSGGIATATSTLMFFNTAREPANAAVLKEHTANLFKAAKQNGFHTYYLSNQESRLTMGLDTANIDELITNDLNPLYFAKHKDEGLTELLQKIGLKGQKNFVVLHMRSPHLPYVNRYKGREAEFEKFKPAADAKDRLTYEVNTYDNALLYTDTVIYDMVKSFENLAKNTNYSIFITADHGQLFDYDNMWGHNNLIIEQAKVPTFIKSSNVDNLPYALSHYELGKMILQDIGYILSNPNEQPNIYYLHGNNVDFPYDFIEYRIDDRQITELCKGNTADLK